MVHNKPDSEIKPIEKLQLLRMSLKDEALRKMNVFPTQAEYYIKVYELLHKSYNPHLLKARHLSLIINCRSKRKNLIMG